MTLARLSYLVCDGPLPITGPNGTGCHSISEPEDDAPAARAEARRLGWRRVRSSDGRAWMDLCPNCFKADHEGAEGG